jgi:hypothetical protein
MSIKRIFSTNISSRRLCELWYWGGNWNVLQVHNIWRLFKLRYRSCRESILLDRRLETTSHWFIYHKYCNGAYLTAFYSTSAFSIYEMNQCSWLGVHYDKSFYMLFRLFNNSCRNKSIFVWLVYTKFNNTGLTLFHTTENSNATRLMLVTFRHR